MPTTYAETSPLKPIELDAPPDPARLGAAVWRMVSAAHPRAITRYTEAEVCGGDGYEGIVPAYLRVCHIANVDAIYRIVTPKNGHSWYNRTDMQEPPRCVNSRGHDTPKVRFGMLSQYTPETAIRFWSKVDCSGGPDACWVWQASVFDGGYGQFKVQERNLRAHRVAWELTHGSIPGDLFVLHRCDNRRCCNPTHLWLGTHKENMADMQRKGRAAAGDQNGSRLHRDRLVRGDAHPARRIPGWSQGERCGMAKLTSQQVQDIRAQYAAGGVTLKTIGLQYGVDKQTIFNIVRRKTWRHV